MGLSECRKEGLLDEQKGGKHELEQDASPEFTGLNVLLHPIR